MWYLRRIAGVTRVCWTYVDLVKRP